MVKAKKPSDMTPKELKALALSLGLYTEESIKDAKKKDILLAIKKHEEDLIAEKPEGEKVVTENTPELTTYNGKKVISSKEVEVNGKKYLDILVETGETYREPKQ